MSETTNHCVAREFPVVAAVVLGLRRQHVNAGLAVRQRLVDREAGRDFLVQLVGDVQLALPDRLAHLVGRLPMS